MKKKQFSILCIGLMLTACGQQNKNETTMDFTEAFNGQGNQRAMR